MIAKRKLQGIKGRSVTFRNVSDGPLSSLLDSCRTDTLYLCGSLEEMTASYVDEATRTGWNFERKYIHKFRSPVFRRVAQTIAVKLVGESWLPGCTNAAEAEAAFGALEEEWTRVTKLPLLATPSKTGQAFLWEQLPAGKQFPALDDDLAALIRKNSPQHRLERLQGEPWERAAYVDGIAAGGEIKVTRVAHKYDGRWMYAALATLDRLPVGEPVRTCEFIPFIPGWYFVEFVVPKAWAHIGLLPVKTKHQGLLIWEYPNRFDGEIYRTWVSEPELAIALAQGWPIEILDGWRFQKGRPLCEWIKKLIQLRTDLRDVDAYASAAIREIANHTIGSLHTDSFEREEFVKTEDWKSYVRVNGHPHTFTQVDGGRLVTVRVKHTDKLSIYMPHWSAQIYALERARIAEHALKCDPATLVEIRGDAIYSTMPLPFTDNGNLGQIRYQGVAEL